MKQIRALLWKEWREDHIYLWIGLGVLLVLPLINAWQEIYYLRRFELHASAWIFCLGGIFVVVVSVGVSCRDLSGALEDFWRSRPVAVGRWMSAKYAAGLFIVLFCCIAPVVVEMAQSKTNDAAIFLIWFPFLWIAIFSISFLIGCLLRKSAQTSLIAISAMLLLYILPIVLPPLRWLNITAVLSLTPPADDSFGVKNSHSWAWLWARPPLYFALGMLALAIICTILALVAVARDWRIAAGRKTMFGSVAAAFLLLLLTTAFQLGTNMPILQTISLPDRILYNNFYPRGDKVTFMAGRIFVPDPTSESGRRLAGMYEDVRVTAEGMQLSAPFLMDEYGSYWAPASPLEPRIHFRAGYDSTDNTTAAQYVLRVIDTSTGIDHAFPLRKIVRDKDGHETSWQDWGRIFHNRLYIPGDQLMIVDISQPLTPKIISKTPYFRLRWASGGGSVWTLPVPSAPGLTDMEQLELAGIHVEDGLHVFTTSEPDGDHLILYRLESLDSKQARFVRIAERGPSVLESLLKGGRFGEAILKAGKVYVTQYNGSTINAIVTVYSATGPHPLTPIGHFGAPAIIGICPLADGRCIVAGGTEPYQPANKLWLVGPPPKRD